MSTHKIKPNRSHALLHALPHMQPAAIETIKAAIATKPTTEGEFLDAVSEGSLLDHILRIFREETPIALEIPLFVALTYVSGYLNMNDIRFHIGGKDVPAKLWTVILGPSCSGKSFATEKISKWLEGGRDGAVVPRLRDSSSAVTFIENFEQTPKGMWIRDEFGQFLHQVQHQTHMFDIKDYLLRAYSGDVVERNTKKSSIRIADHAMSILGITVADTFHDQMGADSMIDGFAQRFNYLIATPDPARPGMKFPIFFEDPKRESTRASVSVIKEKWSKIISHYGAEGGSFEFSEDALELFKATFSEFFEMSKVPESFYRRAMFSGFSYAVVLHVIAEKTTWLIDGEDMKRAMALVGQHLQSAKDLMANYGLSEFEKTIRKAEVIRDRLTAEGQPVTTRKLIAGIREVSNAQQARSLMDFIK